MTLKQTLQSLKPNSALLHYNISTYEQFKAGIEAIKETNIPLIFGVSEGERNYFDIKNIKLLISEAQGRGLPVFLNADHCKSVESAIEAVDNLFDSVLFDPSTNSEQASLPLEENILRTKEVKSRAEEQKTKNNKLILIEGEIGYIPGSSDIKGEIEINEKNFTNPEDAEKFFQQTNVDLLAISVGNVHGIPDNVKQAKNTLNKPQIDFNLIASINSRIQKLNRSVGLVLHGGSGLTDEDFRKSIESGIKIIHINTELRKLWKENLIRELQKETVVPYKIYEDVIKNLKERIIYYQKLFYGI